MVQRRPRRSRDISYTGGQYDEAKERRWEFRPRGVGTRACFVGPSCAWRLAAAAATRRERHRDIPLPRNSGARMLAQSMLVISRKPRDARRRSG